MSFAKSESMAPSLLIWMPFYFFLVSAKARTSSTMLKNCGKSGHPCHVPDLRGKALSFSPLKMVFAVVFLYMAFMILRYVPSIPTLQRVFIKKGCCILSNAFSASVGRIIWFLSFLLLMWCITLVDLQMLNHPCSPGTNPTWSW